MLYLGQNKPAQPRLDSGLRESVLMNNIFYIIGVVVVVLLILGYFGYR
jgi:hypothetical protein